MYDKIKLWCSVDGESVERMARGKDATPIFDKDTLIGYKFAVGAMDVKCRKNSCTIVGALPKMLEYSNIEVLRPEQIKDAVEAVCEAVGKKAEFMRVSYVEVFNAWDMVRPPIEYLCRLGDAGRYMPREQTGTTLYYGRLVKGAKKVLCFYDKGEESKRKGILMQGNILRYEMRLRGRLRKHGITTADTLYNGRTIAHLCQVYKSEYNKINKISLQDMEINKDYLLRCLMANHPDEVQTIMGAMRASSQYTAQKMYRLKQSVERMQVGRDALIEELNAAINGTEW